MLDLSATPGNISIGWTWHPTTPTIHPLDVSTPSTRLDFPSQNTPKHRNQYPCCRFYFIEDGPGPKPRWLRCGLHD